MWRQKSCQAKWGTLFCYKEWRKIKIRTESSQHKQGRVWDRKTEKETKDLDGAWVGHSGPATSRHKPYFLSVPKSYSILFSSAAEMVKILQCLIGILKVRCQSISTMTNTVLPNCYRSYCLKTNSWNKFYS